MTSTKTTTKTNHYFRAVLMALATLAALLLASGVALAATTTFSNSSPIQIPDSGAANPYPSQISVQNLSGNITDVNLKLNGLSHTALQDVDVILQHSNQSAIVMSDVPAASTINDINLTLDDEATNPLPSSLDNPLLSGSFKPTDNDDFEDAAFPSPANTLPTDGSALSVFDGTDPNGTWNLYVVDDTAFDSGQFAGGWSLEITTDSPTPQPDTTAPKVTSTNPAAGATGVSPLANVTATFSEEMQASTINAATFKLFKKGSTTKVAAAVSYDVATDRATLDPTNSLRRGTTYKAVVSTGAKDLAGNRLDQNSTLSGLQQKVWTFKVRN